MLNVIHSEFLWFGHYLFFNLILFSHLCQEYTSRPQIGSLAVLGVNETDVSEVHRRILFQVPVAIHRQMVLVFHS